MTESITNFERICRICFTEIDGNIPISLTSTIIVNELSFTISNALQEIYPFFVEIIKRDDCLPKNICLECLKNLKTSYQFRKICETNNQRILEILNEHDNLGKGCVEKSKHYQYNITKCRYFKDLLIKKEPLPYFSDYNKEQVDYDTDFKDGISEAINEKDIDVKLDNEELEIEECNLKEESLSVIQKSVIDNKFECRHCPKTFGSLLGFRKHEKSHENKYQCNLCSKKFPTEPALELHKRRHTSDSNFTHLCPECGKKFLASAQLVRHRRTHVNIKLYQCNICPKRFSQCYSLKLHKMRHSGYRPNACEICDKRFTTIGNLNEHKITHRMEKPHKCKICGKTWITTSDLKKHMRKHSGEKPYKCQYCEKRFARKETVKVHERIHTGERPYSCNVCNKQFVHLSSLDRHIKQFVHLPSLDRHIKSRCDVQKVETPSDI